jgi:hypothetical protein
VRLRWTVVLEVGAHLRQGRVGPTPQPERRNP